MTMQDVNTLPQTMWRMKRARIEAEAAAAAWPAGRAPISSAVAAAAEGTLAACEAGVTVCNAALAYS